jgi:hypothetical protein
MTEFDKAKVGFVLALLGTVFAISPVIEDYLTAGFDLLGVRATVGFAYASFSVLLSLSVYLFAISFVTQRPVPLVQAIGNAVYVLSLAVPPTYILLYVATAIARLLSQSMDSKRAESILQLLLGVLSGVASSVVGQILYRRLSRRELAATTAALEDLEAIQIQRAAQLHEAGHSDLAVLDAFRAIETALRGAVLKLDRPIRSSAPIELIRAALTSGIIPEELSGSINELRMARNNLVHGQGSVSRETASFLLDEARKILSAIRRYEERRIESAEPIGAA